MPAWLSWHEAGPCVLSGELPCLPITLLPAGCKPPREADGGAEAIAEKAAGAIQMAVAQGILPGGLRNLTPLRW